MTLGADPEVFLEKDGKIISSIGLIKGTKYEPEELGGGIFIQKDNIMAEFNIPPSYTKQEFVDNIQKGLRAVSGYIKPAKIKISAYEIVDEEILKVKEAQVFGCEPDFIVYNKKPQRCIKIENNARCCGGHVHVGYDNPTDKRNEALVRALDLFLGVPSVILDSQVERRSMYGEPGCYRPKGYGKRKNL